MKKADDYEYDPEFLLDKVLQASPQTFGFATSCSGVQVDILPESERSVEVWIAPQSITYYDAEQLAEFFTQLKSRLQKH